MIEIKYTSIAKPPQQYQDIAKGVQKLEKKNNKYIIMVNGVEKEFELCNLKMLFTPCKNYKWEDLEKNFVTTRNEIVKEKTFDNKKKNNKIKNKNR